MRYLYRCAALRLCMGLRGIWYPLRLCADCFGAGSLARSPARSPNRTPRGYNVRGHMRCLTPSAPEKSKRPMPGKVSCPVRNCPNQTKFRLPKSRRKNKKRGSVRKAHQTALKWHGKKISGKGLTNIMIYAILTVRIS